MNVIVIPVLNMLLAPTTMAAITAAVIVASLAMDLPTVMVRKYTLYIRMYVRGEKKHAPRIFSLASIFVSCCLATKTLKANFRLWERCDLHTKK